MGNRASISFKNGAEESVVLCSHWGGEEFHHQAIEYANKLMQERKGKEVSPLDRLEPNTVMVDFIRHITKDIIRVESDLYLGKDTSEVDNSDAGHFIVTLESEGCSQ